LYCLFWILIFLTSVLHFVFPRKSSKDVFLIRYLSFTFHRSERKFERWKTRTELIYFHVASSGLQKWIFIFFLIIQKQSYKKSHNTSIGNNTFCISSLDNNSQIREISVTKKNIFDKTCIIINVVNETESEGRKYRFIGRRYFAL